MVGCIPNILQVVRKLVTLNVTGMFVPKFAAPAARMTGLQWSYGPTGQAEWLTPEIPPATKILPLYRMLCYCVLQWIYMDLPYIYICIYLSIGVAAFRLLMGVAICLCLRLLVRKMNHSIRIGR